MLDLKKFAINRFHNKKISDNKLKLFTEVSLARFEKNNPAGIYDEIISDTTTAYNNYFGTIADEDIKSAVKEGSTVAVYDVLREFKKNISQQEGIVRAKFGLKSDVYQEFFPHGITEYIRANMTNAETLMNRFVSSAETHQAVVGLEFVTLFTNIKNDFISKRETQIKLFGEVQGSKAATSKNRRDLEKQLMKNLLTVALNNIGKPKAIDIYFDQTIIRY